MLAKGTDNPGLLDGDLNRSANVPLPLVSVTPGAPTKRENQRIVPIRNLFRTDLPGTDPSIRERWVAQPPLPVWLNYTAELWTKTRSTMNALVTAFQLKFDPYMAWGTVEIDNWFWGSVWMPIHLDGMQDNSELEGEEDRLLRHTITLRVEAWAFYPPVKDFTLHKPTVDVLGYTGDSPNTNCWQNETTTHFENLTYHPLTRYSSLYFSTNAHRLFQVAVTAGGKLNVVPVNLPPNPVTHYFGERILVFPDGLLLDCLPFDPSALLRCFLLQYSGNLNTNRVLSKRVSPALPTLPPLVVGWEQMLVLGSEKREFLYGSVYLHRSLKLHCRPRYFPDSPDNNLPPVPPPLPYEVPLPK